jgi:HTH-type transcriptional regulator / antitoxin HipB
MWINSPDELGHVVRDRRKELGITQADLAKRVGATRHWVIALEQGNPTAEFDRVLKALIALGLRVDIGGGDVQFTSRAAEKVMDELNARTASRGSGMRRLSTATKKGGADAG